ncbi:MAG TPA: carboxypeptidase regulatory-like domain-containing protein [Bacteroidia bacterium]|nr:carboxypeptidase regulatory-like domain-containing protein [Bacteroidia bacterium]
MKKNYLKALATLLMLICVNLTFAQNLTLVTPNMGLEGTSINVSISGQNSNFQQGTTTVWFNQGSSTLYANNVNVNSSTSLTAVLGIPYGTPLGLYQTNVYDPTDNTISLANSFTVLPSPNSPAIVNVSPNSTMEGTSLNVAITGQNTNFQQGTTTVWFNQGSSTIYANNVNVNSNTQLNAFFVIPFGTPLGLYDTNVQDPIDNTVTSTNSFTITANPNTPDLVSVSPNNGDIGTTIPVTISGQNTNFLQGTGTLVFVQGSSTLITSNYIYNNNTNLGATLTIPNGANPGYYDVYFTNPQDGTMLLLNGFYVNPPPCGNINVDIVQQPCPGGTAFITVTGGYAPYSMIIDGQTFSLTGNYLDYLPPGVGNYNITSLIDNFGCSATSIDSTINNDSFNATLTIPNGACVGNSVTLTSNINSSSSITSVYYNFGNGSISSANSIIYNIPGIYYPSVQVYNSNGCNITAIASTPIEIFSLPQDSIVSLTNANCGTNNGAFEITGIGVGPFNYTITGIGGYTSASAVNTNLAAGTYNINITDNNGCSSSNMLSIANVTNLTSISGTIQTSNGNNAANTTIVLYNADDISGAMSASYSTNTDVNGNYSFSNLTEGNYILSAQPDLSLFPGSILTYSNGDALWFNADTIQVNCLTQQTLNITLLEAVPQTGTAFVGGFVYENTFNPIANAGVVLKDDIANEYVSRSNTDISGNYEFNNVNSGHYSVFVDLPGLLHNNNYTFNLNANDVLWDKSHFVNFGNRTIDTVFFFVGLNEIVEFQTKIYPNPFAEQTSISYYLPSSQNVIIEVYNLIGEKVETLVNERKLAGNHSTFFNAANRSKGVYFVKITAGNSQKTFKIMSAE